MKKETRYHRQCQRCCCYYDNIKDKEVLRAMDGADSECSNGLDVWSAKECPALRQIEEAGQ